MRRWLLPVLAALAAGCGSLERRLLAGSPAGREAARRELPSLDARSKRRAAGALGKALASKDASRRQRALEGLAALGPDAAPALPALLRAAQEGRDDEGEGALQAIRSMREAARPACPELLRLLEHPDERVRAGAYRTAGAACAEADQWRAVAAAAADPSPALRALAEQAGRKARSQEPFAAALGEALDHRDPERRRRTLALLLGMGAGAAPAVPKLMDAAKNGNEAARGEIIDALGRIGPAASAAAAPLAEIIGREAGSQFPRRAFDALVRIAAGGPDPMLPYRAAIDSRDVAVKPRAIEGLRKRREPEAVALLVRALTDPRFSRDAAAALAARADRGAAAVPLLLELADDPARFLDAKEALDAVEAPPAKALKPLLARLGRGKPGGRVAAARLLGKMGGAAASAVPALEGIVSDAGAAPDLRYAAAQALESIRAALP